MCTKGLQSFLGAVTPSQALGKKSAPLPRLLEFVHLANDAARRCGTFDVNRG